MCREERERRAELQRKMDALDRADLVEILEGAGIQCYDHESRDTLAEAILVNIEDGTIDEEELVR